MPLPPIRMPTGISSSTSANKNRAKTVPEFEWLWLVLMVAGGIGGGAVGRKINKKIDDKHVEILFIGLMFTIIGISCYNTWALMK